MTRHLTDEELLLDFYDEGAADDRARLRTHLAHCEQCRALDEELRAVLTAVDTAPISEPPSGFEREMWARIEPLLPVQRTWRTRWNWTAMRRGTRVLFWLHPGRVVRGALSAARNSANQPRGAAGMSRAEPLGGMMPQLAVAASIGILLVAAFMAGRVWERPSSASPGRVEVDRALNERLLRAEVEDHLERSQRVLVELVNADYDVGGPIAGDRARAADLVAAGRLYRRSAEQIGDAEIGRLLEDLERVLVEVANGPADTPQELNRLRQRIDEQDLVFRVRVVSREMRERAW